MCAVQKLWHLWYPYLILLWNQEILDLLSKNFLKIQVIPQHIHRTPIDICNSLSNERKMIWFSNCGEKKSKRKKKRLSQQMEIREMFWLNYPCYFTWMKIQECLVRQCHLEMRHFGKKQLMIKFAADEEFPILCQIILYNSQRHLECLGDEIQYWYYFRILDTYASAAWATSIRIVLALASVYKLHLHQMDV